MSDNLVFTSLVVGDGKITIPKHIRDALEIRVGDLVVIEIKDVVKKRKKEVEINE